MREETAYAAAFDSIVTQHAAQHVYLRFDTRRFKLALSFGDYNPNGHNNHLGLWGYMLEPGMRAIDSDEHGYGGRHITVFTVNEAARLLHTDTYIEADLEEDLVVVSDVYGMSAVHDAFERATANRLDRTTEIEDHLRTDDIPDELLEYYTDALAELAQSPSAVERLETLARMLRSRSEHRQRYTNFYLSIGYVGIEDPLGIIDTTGRTAVIFEPSQVKVVQRYVM